MSFSKIAVLGLGKVGRLAARLLHESGFSVTAFDAVAGDADQPFERRILDVSSKADLAQALASNEAVISCLPYHLNAAVAGAAHGHGLHYFDLTEDVTVTRTVRELAETSNGVMAPQCGLAPGYIGIIGAHLAEPFETLRAIKLRVGALPQHPTGLLGYAFNWSPEGVVNEYLNDCEVIEEGARKWVSPMEWIETVYVQGTKLEAFTTSGGLGTMCETFMGRAENLDYKTMRYPGHVDLMNFFFHELLMRDHRDIAGKLLTKAKPPVDDDVVYVHVSAEGEIEGKLQRKEFVRAYYPQTIAAKRRTAIAWTTSASACAVIELVQAGKLPARGFIQQEKIHLTDLLSTRTGKLFGEDVAEL
ncbi:MAG: saccharopine dehydrogenase C-terminal domain-containing protein [Alphaproteobacteria bacterium]|nr:saccharopine dehydrogenase C-terminal domain-containing protein [Alphaproteobacteria bacterium]MDP6589409.1 saccharopine dehydrogenase C-terminal domain-containing protein [Alphaproteobacteria bacterium]MDP6818577.1 saccharopine dehydrogenase C-terminal domain-containing protein [Alphaproteobacteria bacterium]